ncbi:ImmA/IrrE family metallo-endopeptidase [Fredinandcohnia humi]
MEIPQNLRERMEQLVQNTIKDFNLTEATSPENAAKRLGLTIHNGKLQKVDGAFDEKTKVILINENITLGQRKRFTLFHEICHYLLRNDDEFFSDLNDIYEDDEEFRKVEERLCDMGAIEFAAPKEQVKALINECGFSITLLLDLEKKFHLSKQSAMWRLAECAPHPCILAICRAEFDIYPLLTLVPKEIKVENAWNSKWTPYKLRKETPIPKDHPIWLTTDSFDDYFSFDDTYIQFFSGHQMEADIEGIWINGRVYILFSL